MSDSTYTPELDTTLRGTRPPNEALIEKPGGPGELTRPNNWLFDLEQRVTLLEGHIPKLINLLGAFGHEALSEESDDEFSDADEDSGDADDDVEMEKPGRNYLPPKKRFKWHTPQGPATYKKSWQKPKK